MSSLKENKSMQDVYDLLQASRTHRLFVPEVDESGTLTELQSEMLSWIWDVDSREHANPNSSAGLTDLQKEMLRWILNSNAIQIAMHNVPSKIDIEEDKRNKKVSNIVSIINKDIDEDVDIEGDSDTFDEEVYISSVGVESKTKDKSSPIERDIDTLPYIMQHMAKESQENMDLKQRSAMAIILADKLNIEIRTDGSEVAEAIVKTEKIAKKLVVKMIADIARENIRACDDFEPVGWYKLKTDVKRRYAALLEKKSDKKNGLPIGRCKSRWLALHFLHLAYKNAISRLRQANELKKL